MQEALDELRAKLGDAAADSARKSLAEMVRTGSFPFQVDVEAADEVKRLGLIANYDE